MTIEAIDLWHKRARPNPTDTDFNVQLGCHLEEVAEMLATLEFGRDGTKYESYATTLGVVSDIATALKRGWTVARIKDRREFLDSLADQIVTAVGVGYCAGMKTTEAVARVNSSNWSKFDENGQPTFDRNGKIAKPATYVAPDLEGLY